MSGSRQSIAIHSGLLPFALFFVRLEATFLVRAGATNATAVLTLVRRIVITAE